MEFAASIEKRLRTLRTNDEVPEATPPVEFAKPQIIPASPSEGREEIEILLRGALELAAVSGRFDPRDLFKGTIDEETQQIVLSRLASACEIEHFEGGVRWLLMKDARTDILTRLIKEDRLKDYLKHPLPPTDRFGEMMRELLLHGASVDLAGRTRDDLLALSNALETTADVELQRPDVLELRRLIKGSKFLAEYDVLLTNEFFGRKKEFGDLQRFLTKGYVSKPSPGRSWNGLILTGLGGAGKSTLLAKFARHMFAKRIATVVILDFDRPGVDARDLYWLEAEMSRQVGYQYTETEEMLRHLRHDVRQQKTEDESQFSQFTPESVSYERGHRRIVSGIKGALINVRADARPFLLVLDTFEEVTQRDLEGRLFEWLSEIASRLSPIPLRVIFSGRLYGEDCDSIKNFGVTESVEIDELEPELAESLLVSRGLPLGTASRLARSKVLPRRPLELNLLAKLVGGDERDIKELEDEIRAGGQAAHELFAGIIYRRVLQRIENNTARSLAYPGLVLRYVTTELIQKVLVPAMELPPLDDTEAAQALNALASYAWLTYRGNNGEVYHRKDLRRSMLKVMIANEGNIARKINEGAAKFFGSASTDRERDEGLYHRLMLMREPSDGQFFELAELNRANEHIGADSVDLPRVAAALLKFASDSDISISEVGLLPSLYQGKAYEQTGQRLVKSREFGKASELYFLHRERPGKKPFEGSEDLGRWEIEALFATASWESLRDIPGYVPAYSSSEKYNSGIQLLSDTLFPAEIVSPGLLLSGKVNQDLIECSTSKELGFKNIAANNRETIFQRLAVGLILINSRAALNYQARKAIGTIVKQIRSAKRPALSPTLERRLLFLDCLSSESQIQAVSLSPATLKLNSKWLREVPDYLEGEIDSNLNGLIASLLNILTKDVSGESNTVRRMLGAVDGLSKMSDWRQSFPIDLSRHKSENLLQLLRGPDPEFRDPCRFALLDAFQDHASRMDLGSIFSSVVKLKLEDLDPVIFANALATAPEHALESYVELADRSWTLGELMRQAKKARPNNMKLRKVSDAYERWDNAVNATLLDAFKQP